MNLWRKVRNQRWPVGGMCSLASQWLKARKMVSDMYRRKWADLSTAYALSSHQRIKTVLGSEWTRLSSWQQHSATSKAPIAIAKGCLCSTTAETMMPFFPTNTMRAQITNVGVGDMGVLRQRAHHGHPEVRAVTVPRHDFHGSRWKRVSAAAYNFSRRSSIGNCEEECHYSWEL